MTSNFTPIEYVKGNGSNYIDTGYKPNGNTKYVLTASDISSKGVMFGSYNSTWNTGSGYYANAGSGTDYVHYNSNSNTNYTYGGGNVSIEIDKGKVTINGTVYVNASTQSFTEDNNLYLFAGNMMGQVAQPTSYKLSSMEIYDNGTLVRNFVPATDENGVACLFDEVEDKPYYFKPLVPTTYASDENNTSAEVTKIYAGVKVSYTPVEYIESSGTQCIMTDWGATEKTKWVVDYQFLNIDGKQIGCGRSGDSNNVKKFGVSVDANNFSFMIGGGQTSSVASDTNRHTFIVDAPNQIAYVDDVSTSCPYTSLNSEYPITFFSRYSQWSNTDFVHAGRLYSSKIYSNGVLARDFIPVLDSNNVACLFEKLQSKFYYPSGTGTLTAGNAIGDEVTIEVSKKVIEGYGKGKICTQVEYISNTTTQYVDTGMNFNGVDTDVEVRFEAIVDSDYHAVFGSRVSSSSRRYELLMSPSSSLIFAYDTGTVTVGTIVSGQTYTFKKEGSNLYLNGELATTITATNFNTSYTVYILSTNSAGTSSFYLGSKLHYFKIWNNNVLVKEFIAALDDSNTACLCNKCDGKFYRNAGTGVFTAGQTVGDVEGSKKVFLEHVSNLAPNAISWLYHFDGNGNNAVPNGVGTSRTYSSTAGKFGQAYTGTDNYNSSDEQAMKGNWTIEYWFKPNSNATKPANIGLMYVNQYGAGNPVFNDTKNVSTAGYVFQYVGTGSSDMFTSQTVCNRLEGGYLAGQWYHEAYVKEDNDFRFYVNGRLMARGVVNASGFFTNRLSQVTMMKSVNGSVDEFMLCHVAKYKNEFIPPTSAYTLGDQVPQQ